MLAAAIDVQIAQNFSAETIFGEHSLNPPEDKFFRFLRPEFIKGNKARPSRVAGVVEVGFDLFLFAGHPDFVGVQNDDEIAGVQMGGEHRLPLPPQNGGDFGNRPAIDSSADVHDVPLLFNFRQFRYIGLHFSASKAHYYRHYFGIVKMK